MENQLYTKKNFTLRPISKGAEEWLGRPINCLDHGFVYLVDYMGNDESIAQAARTAYGKGTKKVSDDAGLIRYLRRHDHTTPSEMVEFKFHCKMPIFVARQWIRHRTASVNEYSGRYSEMSNEFYMPERSALAKQSKNNKQGRDEELTPQQKDKILSILKEDYERSHGHYKEMLEMDLARELARVGLSVANYTEWYWKIDLHNLCNFLRLRMDLHAQYEIRVFANAMAKILKDAVPIAYKAFEDYQLKSIKLTSPEIEWISAWEENFPMDAQKAEKKILGEFENKRETEEFMSKLRKLKMVK